MRIYQVHYSWTALDKISHHALDDRSENQRCSEFLFEPICSFAFFNLSLSEQVRKPVSVLDSVLQARRRCGFPAMTRSPVLKVKLWSRRKSGTLAEIRKPPNTPLCQRRYDECWAIYFFVEVTELVTWL